MILDKSVIWERLTKVFRDIFDDDEILINHETTAADIDDWDSLVHIQLLVATEKEFGIRFNTGEVAALANVGEMVELIARRLSKSGSQR